MRPQVSDSRTARFRTTFTNWWSTFLVGTLALLCSLAMVWIYMSMQSETNHRERALITLSQFQSLLAENHLWTEEYLADDPWVTRADVSHHLDSTSTIGRRVVATLRRASRPMAVTPTLDLSPLAVQMSELQTEYMKISGERLARPSSSSAGSHADQRADDIYRKLTRTCQIAYDKLAAHVNRVATEQRRIMTVLLALWILLVTLGVSSIVRRERHRRAVESALKGSESRFRDLARSLPVGVVETDVRGMITFANEDLVRRCEYSRDEISGGLSILELVESRDRSVVSGWIERVVTDGISHREEYSVRKRSGALFSAIMDFQPVVQNNRVTGLRASVVDISDRKDFETALRAEKEKYQALMRIAPVGIFRLDPDGNCVYINERGAYLLGIDRSSATGSGWLKAIHPEDRLRVTGQWSDALKHGKRLITEARYCHADGSTVWVHCHAEPERDHRGRIVTYVGSLSDVTERKAANEAVRESEERFRRLSEAASEGILIHDKGICLDANKVFADFVGCPVDHLIGRSVLEFVAAEHLEVVREHIEQNREETYEIQAVKADGSTSPVELSAHTVPYQGRNVRVVSVRDVSERRRAEEEIAKFKTITDIADYGSAIADLDGKIVYANAHYAKIHGYEPGEMIGIHVRELHDLERLQDFDARLRHFVRTGRQGTTEIWHRRKDGSVFPTLQTAILVTDAAGNPRYMAASVIDISEMKATELKLKQLAALPESNPDLVITIEGSGRILYTNPAVQQLLESHDLAADRIWDYLPRDILALVSRCITRGDGLVDIEREVGSSVWSWSIHPIEGQGIVHCYGRDATVQKQHDREVRKLSTALTQSANIVCITGTDGTIEYVNPRFTEVTGYTPEEVIGSKPSILRSSYHDRRFYEDLWQTITAGHIWTGRMRNRRKDGHHYWERKTITAILDDKGEIINYVSVGEDITVELHAQQKLAESDKMSAIGMLAAGVAHEFKNYLGGIIGNASYALDELESEDGPALARDTFKQIIEMGDKANDVAMSLLSYSKAKPDDFTQEDLSKIINKSVSLVEKELRNLSIELVTYIEDVPRVEVSASKIQQLLLNLLINAQHAIGKNGVITVSLMNDGDQVNIKVADSGVGIAEENIGRIFDPFYSTKGVWGKDELVGTGMGLAICRNIAHEHGGDLNVESIKGIATLFTLSLPVCRESKLLPSLQNGAGRTLRVLVFALDKTILTHYFQAASEAKVRLLWVDSISHLGGDLDQISDLVICDAKFSGKVELLKMVERCRDAGVRYVMVNCGVMEYQLADLYEGSLANFKELPDFSRLLNYALTESATTAEDTAPPAPE